VRYAKLFNERDWDGLRTLLADDAKLTQSTQMPRHGAIEVGSFFGNYAKTPWNRVMPAWLEGREVIAVFLEPDQIRPSYMMQIAWRDGRIAAIRDYRYVRYVVEDAEFEWDEVRVP
jgi:RNA polymerase sigma-70 factor (ECF subfamily)